MHRVDAELEDHGHEDRRADEQHRREIHEGAEQQQQDVDQEKEHVLVLGDAEENCRDLGRYLHDGHHVAEAHRKSDQHHHHGDGLHHAVDEVRQVAPLVVAEDEERDQERVDARHRRRLCGGEHARQDAAHDDDHRDQAPERVQHDFRYLLQCYRLGYRVPAPVRGPEHEPDQARAEQQSRKDPGKKQARDRYAAAGGERIDHRIVRRRDHQRLHRTADGDVGGKHARVALLDHLRDHQETYLERDVRQLVNVRDLRQFRLFLKYCAGHVGQMLNLQKIANEVGISQPTAQSWLSVLETSYIVFTMPPYYRNFNKRLVKSPKLYFYDTGLVCYLLEMTRPNDLVNYYQRGAIFENLLIAELCKHQFHTYQKNDFYFWRDSNDLEVDILFEETANLRIAEIKSSETINSSFYNNMQKFSKIATETALQPFLLYGGSESFEHLSTQVLSWRSVRNFLKKE